MTKLEFIGLGFPKKRSGGQGRYRSFIAFILFALMLIFGVNWVGRLPQAAYGAIWQDFVTRQEQPEHKKSVQLTVGYKKGDGIFLQTLQDTPVEVHADGTTVITRANLPPLEEILQDAGVVLGQQDRAEASLTTGKGGLPEIRVVRVCTRIVTEEEPIPYQVKQVREPQLEVGQTRVSSEGQDGLLLKKFEITTENGVVVKKKALGNEVLREPVPKVISCGVKSPRGVSGVSSRGGSPEGASKVLQMVATAYTHTGQPTASGVQPYVGGVAVDPKVIPLGTRLYVEGYGPARAVDTGGLIKGNRIDLFLETAKECYSWGKRTVNVYVLE